MIRAIILAALVGVLTLFVTAITLIFSKVFRFDRMLGGQL